MSLKGGISGFRTREARDGKVAGAADRISGRHLSSEKEALFLRKFLFAGL